MRDLAAFGTTLRKLREKRGMLVSELAIQVDMGYTHLANIETGKYIPTTKVATKIANYYAIGLDEAMDSAWHTDSITKADIQALLRQLTNQDDLDFADRILTGIIKSVNEDRNGI